MPRLIRCFYHIQSVKVPRLSVHKYMPDFKISVNVSYIQVMKSPILTEILTSLKEYGLKPEDVIVELTESGFLESNYRCMDLWNRLRKHGVMLALDDFGTGYSNFDRILSLKLDVVKFDRSLLLMADQDANSRFMLDYFSTAFERLGYKVLYEGVETDAQEELCIISHADYLQGYKFSKPIPIEELPRFLTRG